MYERRRQPLLSHRLYVTRLTRHALATGALIVATLCLGMAGYHWLEGLAWIDAYVNAAMILGGMGPVAELHTSAGKIFAGTYALFAGLVFLVAIGVVLAPVVHRAMHRFHLDEDEKPKKGRGK
ncbi:MAG: hypothetical protein ABIR28_00435 [Vicinamibacteria bacterium]